MYYESAYVQHKKSSKVFLEQQSFKGDSSKAWKAFGILPHGFFQPCCCAIYMLAWLVLQTLADT
jgi:hypothetical protein